MSSSSVDFISTLHSNQLETKFAAGKEPRRPRHRQSQTKENQQPPHTLTLLNPPSTPPSAPQPALPPVPPPLPEPSSSSTSSEDVEVVASNTNTTQSKRRKRMTMPFLPYHPHRNNVDYLTTNLENVKPIARKSQTNLFLIIAILFMLGGWSIFLYCVVKHRHHHLNDLDL